MHMLYDNTITIASGDFPRAITCANNAACLH